MAGYSSERSFNSREVEKMASASAEFSGRAVLEEQENKEITRI
jgi:hypothetical protein